MKSRNFGAAIACALLVAAPAAHAAPEWHITPYLWAAGFDGTIGAAGGDSGFGDKVSVDFGSLSSNMRVGGFMLNGSWRDGRLTAFGDWTYAKVKSDSGTNFPNLVSSVNGEVKGNIVQANFGYDLMTNPGSHFDVYGGVRFYDLDVTVGLNSNILNDHSLTGSANWVDGVVGGRWSTGFGNGWQAYAQGDVGTGGSKLSYQAIAAAGYKFSWGSIFGGWRYLHVDYEDGPYRLDAAITGPLLGASFQF